MCKSKYFDAFAVGASLVVGMVLGLLSLLGVLVTAEITPVLGLALGAFGLLLVGIAATSLLKQDAKYALCVCRIGSRAVLGATALIAVSAFVLAFSPLGATFLAILFFLLFTLAVYTLITLYCMMRCIAWIGCGREESCLIR